MNLTKSELSRMKKMQKVVGVEFKDLNLLYRALCHTSYVHEKNQISENIKSNERLEFLGDAIVGLIIVEELFKRYPDTAEGDLSKAKAVLASETVLSRVARKLDLGRYLFLGRGELHSGGRNRDSILADSVEALCGALFLDRGLDFVKNFLLEVLSPYIKEVMDEKLWIDYKTKLQEITQSEYKLLPEYHLMEVSGPPHNPVFIMEVTIMNRTYGIGKGKTKKEAEQEAACKGMKKLSSELLSKVTEENMVENG